MYQALAEHKLAKVLVRSQQKGAAAVCEGENPGVVNPWIKLLNVYDLVTGRPQGGDDRCIDVFVRHQVQRRGLQAASAASG